MRSRSASLIPTPFSPFPFENQTSSGKYAFPTTGVKFFIDEARGWLERARDGDRTDGLTELALLHLSGPTAAATRALERLADSTPRPNGALVQLIEVLLARDEVAKARARSDRFAEAEPLLLAQHEQITTSAERTPAEKRAMTERLAKFYESWHAAEPGKGLDKKAAAYRTRLSEEESHTTKP